MHAMIFFFFIPVCVYQRDLFNLHRHYLNIYPGTDIRKDSFPENNRQGEWDRERENFSWSPPTLQSSLSRFNKAFDEEICIEHFEEETRAGTLFFTEKSRVDGGEDRSGLNIKFVTNPI